MRNFQRLVCYKFHRLSECEGPSTTVYIFEWDSHCTEQVLTISPRSNRLWHLVKRIMHWNVHYFRVNMVRPPVRQFSDNSVTIVGGSLYSIKGLRYFVYPRSSLSPIHHVQFPTTPRCARCGRNFHTRRMKSTFTPSSYEFNREMIVFE